MLSDKGKMSQTEAKHLLLSPSECAALLVVRGTSKHLLLFVPMAVLQINGRGEMFHLPQVPAHSVVLTAYIPACASNMFS